MGRLTTEVTDQQPQGVGGSARQNDQAIGAKLKGFRRAGTRYGEERRDDAIHASAPARQAFCRGSVQGFAPLAMTA